MADNQTLGLGMALSRAQKLADLLQHCNLWLDSAKNWRRQNFELDWEGYQRDADSIYNPDLAARKRKHQSRAFIPITPSHRETIKSWIYKTVIGSKPILEIQARGNPPDDQAENIRDIIVREIEKSEFPIAFDEQLDDATTYGTGFMRIWFEEREEERQVLEPVEEPLDIKSIDSMVRFVTGQRKIIDYKPVLKPVVTYRGVRSRWLSIWDVFPDPMGLKISRDHPIAYRFKQTMGDIRKLMADGVYLAEAEVALADKDAEQIPGQDRQRVMSNRDQTHFPVKRVDNAREFDCYEYFAMLPKKWLFLDEDADDPDALLPARVIFHQNAILAVELNESYDGEPPIEKMDYMPVNGQFYGRGIPEMLKDVQETVNESVNYRLDYLYLALNKKILVIEKAILYPREDFNEDPGGFVRLDIEALRDMGLKSVQDAVGALQIGNLDKSAFIDPQEMERYAQERTSANRVTFGSAGQVRDQNDTLGGMRLLKEAAGEKFSYVGLLMEVSTLLNTYRAYWKAIYPNLTMQDVVNSIGEERAKSFIPLSPEQIEKDYKYIPQGIYTQESRVGLQERLIAIDQAFRGVPWYDEMANFDKQIQSIGEDPEEFKRTPEEMQEYLVAQGMMNMPPVGPQDVPPVPRGDQPIAQDAQQPGQPPVQPQGGEGA